MPDPNRPSPNDPVTVAGVSMTRGELESGVLGAAFMRAVAKKNHAPLDGNDVKAFLAITMADGHATPQEWSELFATYVLYIDRMTPQGLDAMYKVLSARVEDRAPDLGFTVKDATDLLAVYHEQHKHMTPGAKKEMQGFLFKFFS